MVVDFVCELVEAAESVDLVVADICDRGIDEAGGLGADGGDHLGLVAIAHAFATAAHRAGRHEESVVGRDAAGRGGECARLHLGGRCGYGGGVGRGQRVEGSSRGSESVCHGLVVSVVDGKWVPHTGPLGLGQAFVGR